MSSPIEYRRPNESCLEIFRTDIAKKRRLQWSYRAITRSLMDEHQFKIDWTSVRRFCLVRKIEKGVGETTSAPPVLQEAEPATDSPSQPLVRRRKPRENPFHYEDTGPLQTRLNTPSLTQDEVSPF